MKNFLLFAFVFLAFNTTRLWAQDDHSNTNHPPRKNAIAASEPPEWSLYMRRIEKMKEALKGNDTKRITKAQNELLELTNRLYEYYDNRKTIEQRKKGDDAQSTVETLEKQLVSQKLIVDQLKAITAATPADQPYKAFELFQKFQNTLK